MSTVWYCDLFFSFRSRPRVGAGDRAAGPAPRSSVTASVWFSDLLVVPVRARQTASLALVPLVTALEVAAL
jgi:hypothetical protein